MVLAVCRLVMQKAEVSTLHCCHGFGGGWVAGKQKSVDGGNGIVLIGL